MNIYAHRGASEYAPENTFSAFYLGLIQGANGIETDIRLTKDNVPVLFHDETLMRVTGETGKVSDYTMDELKEFKVRGNTTADFFDRIVTLREFLSVFGKYNINFALELKDKGLESVVLSLVNEYRVVNNSTITSFDYENIKIIREKCDYIKIGWLVDNDGVQEIERLKKISGEVMCPKASEVTAESVELLKNAGFLVRPWGVVNVELMKKMCEFGVDGMTVNFPDRLFQYVNTVKSNS